MAEEIYCIEKCENIDQITQRTIQMLASVAGTNSDFLKDATAECVVEYFPMLKLSARYEANWTASFGYKKKIFEKYVNSSGNLDTRYRDEIDWKPANGRSEGNVEYYLGARAEFPEDVQLYLNSNSIPNLDSATSDMASEHQLKFTRTSENDLEGDRKKYEDEKIMISIMSHRQGDSDKDWAADWRAWRSSAKCIIPIASVTLNWKGKSYKYITGCWEGATVTGDAAPSENKFGKFEMLSALSLLLGVSSCIKATKAQEWYRAEIAKGNTDWERLGAITKSWEHFWIFLFITFFAAAALLFALNTWTNEVKRRPFMKPEEIKLSIFDQVVELWNKISKNG